MAIRDAMDMERRICVRVLHRPRQQEEGEPSNRVCSFALRPPAVCTGVPQLERHVANAYDGSLALPPPPRQARSFFITNRRVCIDWRAPPAPRPHARTPPRLSA